MDETRSRHARGSTPVAGYAAVALRHALVAFVLWTSGPAAGPAWAQEEAAAGVEVDSSGASVTYHYGNTGAIRPWGLDRVRRRLARIGAAGRARRAVYPIYVVIPPQGAIPLPGAGSAAASAVERALLGERLFRTTEIVFSAGRRTPSPASEPVLDAVGEVLARYPAWCVEVAGHTDALGAEAYNERLSQARAEAVRHYLLDRFSIAPERLTARGYGETQPVASNDTPEGRALNRRVEFRLVN